MEVELVSPTEHPITVFAFVFVSPREVNGLRKVSFNSFNLIRGHCFSPKIKRLAESIQISKLNEAVPQRDSEHESSGR